MNFLRYILLLLLCISLSANAQKSRNKNYYFDGKWHKIYLEVDSMPSYPGGNGAMMSFISKNYIYPEELADSGIIARSVARFVVNEDGSISDIRITKSGHPKIDTEVIRVIKSMPKFKPGKHKGKYVKVEYPIPFNAPRLQ